MASRPVSTSRLANLAARRIFGAWEDYRQRFRVLTRRATRHFEQRDWARQRQDVQERQVLYRAMIDQVEGWLRDHLGDGFGDRLLWVSMKAVYSGLIAERPDWDLAETFFNSVTRRVFDTVGVDPLVEFVDTDFDQPPTRADRPGLLRVDGSADPRALCRSLLHHRFESVVWADRDGDVARMATRVQACLEARGLGGRLCAEVLVPVFFRGKGAYLVGRLLAEGGSLPLVICLRNGPAGVFVDALLMDVSDVSVLFSYTRNAFLVDVPRPHDVVDFLQQILPRKPRGELYISLGEPKQGKTELYRSLLHYLDDHPEVHFEHAPGIPGLVMVVFTPPGHDVVVKVMRDHFPPEKKVTHALVEERYRWVYTHDRAGRLLDAQPFEHLSLPLDHFSPRLLEELLGQCGASVRVEDDQLVFELAWIERRITPLDLYVRQAPGDAAEAAVEGLAQALRELAACGIFPGDLLPKNFGVTRAGRVAFYDYDEVVPLGSCVFREIPEPRTEEQALSPAPWYPVGPDDVFPEEFPRFLGLPGRYKRQLLDRHGELFTPRWWREVQDRVRQGKIVEFAPYPDDRRLR